MEQYIGFRLNNAEYAIPITKVREIINLPEITRIPQSPSYLTGITNLRGSVIPVVNLKTLLSLFGDGGAKIIVISSGRITFGLLVDGITGVVGIDQASVEPPDNLPQGNLDKIEGIAKAEGRLIVLLDTKKLIPLEDLSLLEDYTEEIMTTNADGSVEITKTVQTIAGEMRVKELHAAKEYFEKNKGVSADDPRQEILDDIITFMNSISDHNYDQADEAIKKIASLGQGELFHEVGKITRRLHDSIKSFKEAIDPKLKDMAQDEIPHAVDKLHYVIERTEEAANKTMSVVEKYTLKMDELSAHIRKLEGPSDSLAYMKDFKNGLEDDLTEILTTQSFQDLTGQTIKKVITLVGDIEAELVRLVTSFGVRVESGAKEPAEVSEKVSQSDVDDLLKEMGF